MERIKQRRNLLFEGKIMKKVLVLSTVVCLFISSVVSAELTRGIEIDFVPIANPGNPGDTRTEYPNSAQPYGSGSVDYTYRIGKYEITNAQWDAFVSAAGAPTGNLVDGYDPYDENIWYPGANVPTHELSWYEATQFCNYLTSGDKSKGAYKFSGMNTNPGDFLEIDRASAISSYDTVYVLPTRDEWYKAAYYTGSGYSTYANGTDVTPIAGLDSNYDYVLDRPWDVGSGIQEQNGTYDMMGNILEWNEWWDLSYRGVSGGSYYLDTAEFDLGSSAYYGRQPFSEQPLMGFRVVVIPEPATLLLLGLGGLLIRKCRQ